MCSSAGLQGLRSSPRLRRLRLRRLRRLRVRVLLGLDGSGLGPSLLKTRLAAEPAEREIHHRASGRHYPSSAL